MLKKLIVALMAFVALSFRSFRLPTIIQYVRSINVKGTNMP